MDANTEVFSQKEWEIILNELALTEKETEIVQQLFSGLSDKQVSMKLNMAIPTVRTHISRLFSKFDLHDRNELILYIFRHFRKRCRTNGNGCVHWMSCASESTKKSRRNFCENLKNS